MESQEEGGMVKTVIMFLVAFAVAVGYYLLIDKGLMTFQNLPFPYK